MRATCRSAHLAAPEEKSTCDDVFDLSLYVRSMYSLPMNSTRYIARCKKCDRTTSALVEGHPASPRPFDLIDVGVVHYTANGWTNCLGMIALACPGCGMARSAQAVQGKFSAKHVCNAKCMASTGPACECSCGGKNHGASHAA
jgi:hypothetical protein